MKKIKVNWTEREVVEYLFEEEIEVDDNFTVNSWALIDEINLRQSGIGFDSKSTDYGSISEFKDKGTGELKIPEIEINSYVEILPPSPEDKKEQYLDEIERLSFIIADTIAAKERVKEQLKQIQQ
jgi:hypothetical protein